MQTKQDFFYNLIQWLKCNRNIEIVSCLFKFESFMHAHIYFLRDKTESYICTIKLINWTTNQAYFIEVVRSDWCYRFTLWTINVSKLYIENRNETEYFKQLHLEVTLFSGWSGIGLSAYTSTSLQRQLLLHFSWNWREFWHASYIYNTYFCVFDPIFKEECLLAHSYNNCVCHI